MNWHWWYLPLAASILAVLFALFAYLKDGGHYEGWATAFGILIGAAIIAASWALYGLGHLVAWIVRLLR